MLNSFAFAGGSLFHALNFNDSQRAAGYHAKSSTSSSPSSFLRKMKHRSCSTSGPVTTWMGDCLRTGKPTLYVTNHPGQLSHPSLRGS